MFYAGVLYDPGHQCVFAYHAHHDLTQAVELINRHPHLGDARLERIFAASAADIARRFDLAAIAEAHRPAEGSLGRSKTKHTYRRWCLMNVLFLNPVNDIEQTSIAASDALTLPSFTLPINDPPGRTRNV